MKRCLITKNLTLTVTGLVLVALFSITILTVESHATNKGSFASRCPTVIEGNVELAVDAPFGITFQSFGPVDYLPLMLRVSHISQSTNSSHVYRGPPQTAL